MLVDIDNGLLAFANILTLIGGGLAVYSTLPVFVEQLTTTHSGTAAERRSRLRLAAGNGLLIPVGIIAGVPTLSLLAAVNSSMNAAVWIRMRRAKRKCS